MAVATITLESSNGDSVVVSAPNDDYLADDIILDTDPDGLYDTGFTVRTKSGAFEQGGRIVGESVPIREMVLPFWLTPASRPRFQALWGTPGNFRKVKWLYDGPSGLRTLTLKLSKQIQFTTEEGFDAGIDDVYHAVVSAIAVNPMYEGAEDVEEWVNPDDRFTVEVVASDGTFPLIFTPTGGSAETTTDIAYDADPAAVQSALEALPSVGAGNVTVTGSASDYLIVFAVGVNGILTSSTEDLVGTGIGLLTREVNISYAPNTGWFDVWNPTDQPLWLEWTFDPAQEWQFPDFAFGQELEWGRTPGEDAARMIVTPELTQMLSVMSDPFMDTYVNADLSNAAGLFNGVEPLYAVPPYTGTEADPEVMPVICRGPAGAKVTLRQRRFWSAESGLEA
ncbi:hypothetical protein [Mycolicibacterium elephantis]|uniref:hypothetical protein n=1 Tax=Mycolicibacterium elephantis TaxID=81858 RepID=UPI0007EA6AE1|nr:hypothetical protein [Mycolicibacterium elephantis]OBB20617.1 hypothetical protein A5762_15285 [Mycolicibacterium elephantis]